jgi:diguanylate cyclase (GGDEF)-like protein
VGFVGDATVERVLRFVEPAASLTEEIVASVESGDLVGSPETVAAQLLERLQFRRDVFGAYLGYPDGSYVCAWRVETGFEVEFIEVQPERRVMIRQYDEASRLVSSAIDPTDTFDPRMGPWYDLARYRDVLAWTDPFTFSLSGTSGVSATLAARDRNGGLIAIAGTQVNLEDISTLLGQIPLGSHGEAFVLGEDRTVVAAPPRYTEIISEESGETEIAIPARALGLPDAPPEAASGQSFAVFGRDDDYITLERSFPTESGIRWTLYLRATPGDLSTSVGGFERTMLWLTVLIAVLVALATFVLYRVRGPLGELRHRAGTDDLTGLANRRRLFEEGAQLVRSAHDTESRVGVAMFDLDGFKKVNDEFGHEVGDDVLREIAVSLFKASRERDLVARLGGDEFVTVMRVTNAMAAERAVERSRSIVEDAINTTFPQLKDVGVTAGFSVSDAGLQDLGTLIHEADIALVRGKKRVKGMVYPSARLVATQQGKKPS